MDEKDILEKLCYYDSRNPDYQGEDFKPEDKCYCDNCFYGRSELANEILLLREKLDFYSY